jgi:hypothetical protein
MDALRWAAAATWLWAASACGAGAEPPSACDANGCEAALRQRAEALAAAASARFEEVLRSNPNDAPPPASVRQRKSARLSARLSHRRVRSARATAAPTRLALHAQEGPPKAKGIAATRRAEAPVNAHLRGVPAASDPNERAAARPTQGAHEAVAAKLAQRPLAERRRAPSQGAESARGAQPEARATPNTQEPASHAVGARSSGASAGVGETTARASAPPEMRLAPPPQRVAARTHRAGERHRSARCRGRLARAHWYARRARAQLLRRETHHARSQVRKTASGRRLGATHQRDGLTHLEDGRTPGVIPPPSRRRRSSPAGAAPNAAQRLAPPAHRVAGERALPWVGDRAADKVDKARPWG